MGKGHKPIDKGQRGELMADAVDSIARGTVQCDWARAGHIFREAPGHVYPTTVASRERYARLFAQVASNPANRRLNAPLPRAAVTAGVQVYVQA